MTEPQCLCAAVQPLHCPLHGVELAAADLQVATVPRAEPADAIGRALLLAIAAAEAIATAGQALAALAETLAAHAQAQAETTSEQPPATDTVQHWLITTTGPDRWPDADLCTCEIAANHDNTGQLIPDATP